MKHGVVRRFATGVVATSLAVSLLLSDELGAVPTTL